MDAILPRSRFWHRSEGSALAAIQVAIAGILTAVISLTAVFLLSRRLTGALIHPLPPAMMLGVGMMIACLALGSRSFFPRHGAFASQSWLQKISRWSASIALVLIAISISLPGSSLVGLAALWLIVLGEEVWYWKSYQRRASRSFGGGGPPSCDKATLAINAIAGEPTEEAEWQSSSLTQRLTYERTDAGGLAIEGWLRADFQPQQRIAAVHVAFCPPLTGSPHVEAEPLDGPDCTVRPTLVLPWGVRWEIKLDVAATEPQYVILGFHAAEGKE